MNKAKIIAILLSMTVAAGMYGCSKKDKISSSDAAPETSASDNSEASSEEKSSEPESSVSTESVSASTESTTESTTASEKLPENSEGYPDGMSAAKAYYSAYIDHDAEAVYSMFNREEIEGFYKVMEPALEGKSAEEVFRKAAVIRATESSMDNIKSIMDGYAVSANDKWSVLLSDEDLKEVSKEKLDEFNTSLGTSYTSGAECSYVFYVNDNNEESFTGNSSAFMEKDGKWYLSFSNAMGTDLLNYIELE